MHSDHEESFTDSSHSTNPVENQSVVLASGNLKKLKEMSAILQNFAVQLLPQSDFKVTEAVEDGLTFVENAIKKARNACAQTGKPAIADDSGIEVDFLRGRPGIYSARFAGESASDLDNLNALIKQCHNAPEKQRSARYQCVIVYLEHAEDPTPIIAQASWHGVLLTQPRGDGGFGYDPIFFCPASKKTAAQMSAEEKSAISHRGKALRLFQQAYHARYRADLGSYNPCNDNLSHNDRSPNKPSCDSNAS